MFDLNKDGRITECELQSVLKSLGINAKRDEVHQMIRDADKDGNGTVEFNEFLQMMRRYSLMQKSETMDEQLREVFDVFDHNRDCKIDFDEIKQTMHILGETVTDSQVREMIREADKDHDGFVDFDEFKCMLNLLHRQQDCPTASPASSTLNQSSLEGQKDKKPLIIAANSNNNHHHRGNHKKTKK